MLSAGYSFAKQKVMMKCCFSGGRTVTSFKHRISTTKWQERKRGNRKMNWTCKQKQECSISIHSLEATKITPKYMLFAFNETQKLFLKNLLAERMWIFERLSCQNHQIPRRITQPKATYIQSLKDLTRIFAWCACAVPSALPRITRLLSW